jgi:hypothetical protein
MTSSEQNHRTCAAFREQIAQLERHIKDHKIYTSFNFARLITELETYNSWAQANAAVIESALSSSAHKS